MLYILCPMQQNTAIPKQTTTEGIYFLYSPSLVHTSGTAYLVPHEICLGHSYIHKTVKVLFVCLCATAVVIFTNIPTNYKIPT